MGSVQGVILDEMRMYVVGTFGDPAWAEVMKRAGRPANHEYLSDKVYPDQELRLLAMHAPDALPTKIHAKRTGPDTVQIVYDSPLRACSAVRGIIQGAALHYRVEVEVTEEQCVLRGDPACVITVKGQ